jgi:hypothetical protein
MGTSQGQTHRAYRPKWFYTFREFLGYGKQLSETEIPCRNTESHFADRHNSAEGETRLASWLARAAFDGLNQTTSPNRMKSVFCSIAVSFFLFPNILLWPERP